MAKRSSIEKVSSQFEADDGRFELEPLEPRLLLSADPLGNQVSADLSAFQPDRESAGAALDADSVNAFISALHQPHQDSVDMDNALPAALDLGAIDAANPLDNDTVLDYLAGSSESLLGGIHDHDESTRHEIIFVDTRTPDYEALLADVHQRDSGIRYDIIMLDAETDGIDQISDVLNAYHDLDAVHFISHGSTDGVQLGDTWLQSANIEQYASRIAGWQDNLSVEADLLFYGCNLAGSESGKHLVEQLNQLTDADVAASLDLTGGSRLGGDWELEHQVGEIETGIALSDTAQQQWHNVLGPPVFQNAGPYNIDEGASAGTAVGDIDADDGDGGALDVGITYSITTNVNPDADGNNAFVINSSTGEITVNDPDDLDFESAASLSITVEADDGAEISTTNVTVDINDIAPTVSATGAATVSTGDAYTLNLNAIEPGLDSVSGWIIDWGDGTIEKVAGNPSTATHTYTNTGFTNNIVVSATDASGTYIPGDLLVTSNGTNSIFRYDATSVTDGAPPILDQEFADGNGLSGVVDVEIGPDGLVYATGFGSNDLHQYDAVTGAFVDKFSAGSQLSRMAAGPDGNLYVTSMSTDEVLRFDIASGTFSVFVTAGSGTLDQPDGVAFGADGNLYVSSGANGKILRYDGTTGAFIDTFTTTGTTGYSDIQFGPNGNLFFSNLSANKIVEYDAATGVDLGDFVINGSGGINGAAGFRFGPDGDLYVASFNDDQVYRYNGTNGSPLGIVVTTASGMDRPINLVFTPVHQVTVLDNQAPVFQNAGPYNIDEGASFGATVGNVDADDGDGGAVDAGITYSITTNVNPDADGNNAFAINSSTGEITVNDTDDIDFEINTSLTITVQADDGVYTTSTDVTIDVNDIAPGITAGGAATVSAGDTYTLDLKAIEPGTNDIISYTVNWGDGTITTEAYTGPTTTASHVYNTAGFTHSITVAATDGSGTTWTASDLLVGNWVIGGDDIFRFDGESGNPDGTFDPTGGVLDRPYTPVVGPDGNYYVSGYDSNNIVKFAADGSYLGVFSADAQLNQPTDMVWGSDGHLYVANYGADNILRIAPDGSSLSVWGTSGGTLNGPTGLAFGPDGDLYVASWINDRLVKFDGASGGAPTLVIGSGLNNPEQIVFDATGNLYIANGGDDEVAKWDGAVLTSYFSHPDLSLATGLAFGPDGQLYVSSYTNDKILRYDGITGEVFADDGPGGLDKPEYLTFTPDHQVTVTGNQPPTISVPTKVFINELHYDNAGVDVGEAVEVMAPAGTDLTGWSLVFYSGADGLAYHTEVLGGTIPNQADNFGTLAFAIAPIQNAATAADGIALVNASADVVQFISYEGTLTAGDGPAAGLTSTDIGVAEDGATLVGDSLQLTGTGSEMTWMAASTNTFGALNTGQNVFAQDTGTEDTDNVYTHGQMLALLGASDTDDADAVLTVNISNVVNGTLTLTGGIGGLGTTFTFTPDLHFNGQLTFDYQVFDDDLAASAIGNGIITIAPVNDNPTGSGMLTATSVDDNAVAVNLFGALSVADVDIGENDLVLRITLSDATAGAITGGGFIDQGSGVYTASALTVAQANTALDNVQFTPVDNSGSTGSFTTDISVDVDDQGGAGYQPVLSATTVTINRVNDAPTATNLSSTSAYNEGDASVAITDIVVSDVDAGETITATLTLANTTTGALSANDGASYTAATGVWTITDSVANVNTALTNLAFTPNTNNEVDTSISVVIDDGDEDTSGPLTGTITLDVTPLNDAPTATNLTSTSSYNEGDASVAITDIVVSDVDSGESITATLTLANTASGSLSANDGASYTAATGVWTITDTVANVNTALANLTFTPTTNNEIDTTISVVIDDGDEDASGPLTGTITLDVTPLNDAPSATNLTSTSSYNEGDASVAITDIVVSDVDSGESITATLTLANTASGSLSANDGASYTAATGVWTITDTVANVNTALANLTFTPAVNNDVDTTISVSIDDGDEDGSGPLTGTITLDVTPVNDIPTSANNSVSTVENMAITFDVGDFVFTDIETGSIVSLRIDSLPGNGVLQNGTVLLNPGDVVLAADLSNLTYIPNTNYNGSDSFTFSVSDGMDYSVNPNTMTITVSAVNNVPTSMDSSTSTNEDQARTFTAADFPFADVESASIVALRIDALPSNGVLMNGTTAINAGDVVAAADLANLNFTPTADFNGTDSFVFRVYDGIDYSATANTMTIAVNAINDIPTSGDFSITTMQDLASSFSASDFPFADAEITGIVALRIDALPSNGVLMNGTTVLNAGDVVLAADLDQLSYTPNAGFNGSDSFGFSVSDGTAYSSAPSTVTASVTPPPTVPPVVAPLADPLVVVRPDVPVVDTVADPLVAETTAEEADTVTEDVTEDESTSQDEPAEVAEAPAILAPPDGLGAPQAAAAIPDHDSSQRVSVDSSVNVNLQGLLQSIKIQLPGWDNLLLEAGELFDPMNLLESNDFNRDMDQLREEAAEDVGLHKMKAGTGVVLTTSLTVGYVAYLVRGGVLLSSVLSTLPVWNFIDPTPILASMKNSDDDDSDADESLESLVAQEEQSSEAEDEEMNKEDKV